MTSPHINQPRSWVYYALIGVFSAVYLYLTFTRPVTESVNRFDLTVLQFRFVQLTIALPIIVLWFLACYNALVFYRYAYPIRNSNTERGYLYIAYGLLLLLANLILGSLIGSVRSLLEQRGVSLEVLTPIFALASTYSQIIIYLTAFIVTYIGSRRLLRGMSRLSDLGKRIKYILVPVLLLSIIYVYLIFQNPYRTVSDDSAVSPTYYVSDWLIILTIVIPYFFTWLFAAMAAFNIIAFSRRVRGVIYRSMLNNFVAGMLLMVSASAAWELIRQFPVFFARTTLGWILVIIYALIGLIVGGYLLISRSAKRLSKIETV